MGILFLLNDTLITHYGQTYDIALNFIGQLINILVNGIGIVGVGIIVFSLILKAIVLPFDIIQRVNMRKQNQKMAENKDKLEKLQKQYPGLIIAGNLRDGIGMAHRIKQARDIANQCIMQNS